MKNRLLEGIEETSRILTMWLPLKIEYDKTPGLSVGIMYKGNLVYGQGFGFSDIEKKQKVTTNTAFHIASISKMFTVTAIMQLVEKGRLHLDDKIQKFIPWFKARTSYTDAENITIRQLLSHTSGIFRDGDTPHWETGEFPSDLQVSFSPKSLTMENLTGFKYTNYGYALLGLVIERVSGVSFHECIQRNILDPLGMRSTFPDYVPSIKNLATGYGRETPGEKIRVFRHIQANSYAPATGFLSSTTDLSKFLAEFSFGENSEKLLGRETKKEMMRPYGNISDREAYGLGLEIFYIYDRKIIGHGGAFQGFITQIGIDTRNEIGVIVLGNGQRTPAFEISRSIFEFIYSYVDIYSHFLREKNVRIPMYEGIYRNIWFDVVVASLGNTLISFSAEADLPLKHVQVYKSAKKKHSFVPKSKIDVRGELVTFRDFKNDKAESVVFGASSMRRVKKKK